MTNIKPQRKNAFFTGRKTKYFKKFNHFKVYFLKRLQRISFMVDHTSFNTAIEKIWASSKRTGTFILEPIFLELFDQQASNFPNPEDIPKLCSDLKTKSVSAFRQDFIMDLDPKIIKKVFSQISFLFGLTLPNGDLVMFRPADVEEAVHRLPSNTSSGFPNFMTKHLEKSRVISQIYNLLNLDCIFTFLEMPISQAWRTQQRVSGIKFRQINVTPMLNQGSEMIFFKPFFDHFEKFRTSPYCFGNTFVDLSKRISKIREFNDYYIEMDFVAFDQSINNELLSLFYKWTKTHLKISNFSYNLLYEAIVEYNLFASIVTSEDGETVVVDKTASLLSGSVSTNFCGSFINLFVFLYYMESRKIDISTLNINILGDDCLIGLNSKVSIKDMSIFFKNKFNLDLSQEKSVFGYTNVEYFHFLGYDINEFERILDIDLVIKQLIVSERFIPESTMSTEERIFSKFCSLLFKCTDGHLYFDYYIENLMAYLNLDSIPEYYTELFISSSITAGDLEIRNVYDMKYKGWKIQ
jgi:hypothetical protein